MQHGKNGRSCLLQPSKEESFETKKYLETSVLIQFCPKSCAWQGVNPCIITAWGPTDWEAAERKWPGVPGRQDEYEPAGHLYSKECQQHPGLHNVDYCQQVQGDAAPFLLSTAEVHWSAGSSSGSSSTGEKWTYWNDSSAGSQRWLRFWSIYSMRRGWELGSSSLERA